MMCFGGSKNASGTPVPAPAAAAVPATAVPVAGGPQPAAPQPAAPQRAGQPSPLTPTLGASAELTRLGTTTMDAVAKKTLLGGM